MARSKKENSSKPKEEQQKQKYLKQTNMPSYSTEEALRVAEAIINNYAGEPTSPLKIAKALDMLPSSVKFRMMCGSSSAYGFTQGGSRADKIAVEKRARDILESSSESVKLNARREALLAPRVPGAFLKKYNGSPIPRNDIAQHVLEEMGIPEAKAEDVLKRIVESAEAVGFVETIKGKKYIDLSGIAVPNDRSKEEESVEEAIDEPFEQSDVEVNQRKNSDVSPQKHLSVQDVRPGLKTARARRVFITHGKNKSFIEPIKKLLSFGELEAVVSVEKQSVSIPVPDKVMNDMRGCGAAIIHVEDEMKLMDQKAEEHVVLNPNVLIEIGAAMALYGRRFILLVKDGVELPSNLQGLYEVRYTGDALDGNATIRLLEAIIDIKNHPLPEIKFEEA